ncbi:MAG TPA: serine hydrolase domain-containing protein [Candidatus Sulfotelmatobacter sp.]|nr:serine hydrolase domain-containing protein [Candidatus Sulfotelmatobacter sp.]
MKWIVSLLFLFILPPCIAAGKQDEQSKPAQSIDELRQQLQNLLKDTRTPGVSVAIVHKDGPEWVAGLGIADVASNRANTADTLFRIGSTSKAFAALSILMLADQGKLSLEDPVHKLAPEVWFENRWGSTDPIRIVHLLEHTTGWDDMHFREYAKQAPDTMGVREGLDYDHHSRISRWRPGTRMAYCNSGPPVAAYIVEKLTGQRFEDFVRQNLFAPIGMKTATYFEPAAGTTTTLYHGDGKTPFSYWHILLRPAGSINASAKDMAAYVQFYLNRGAVEGKQIVPASDIDRMEVPESTWAAKDGLKFGYGLSNYASVHEGFVYHGHNGGVEGGLTEMAYLPESGTGYFFSINSGSGDAFDKVGKAIRAYITRNLQKPVPPPAVPLAAAAGDYAGWYEPDSPRIEMLHFLERLLGISHVHFAGGNLCISSLGARNETFVPVTINQFRHVPQKDPPYPAPTLALLSVNSDGRFIQAEQATMKRISTWMALVEVLLTAWVLLAVIAVLLYAPFWILGGISKRRRRRAERPLRLWPLIAVVSLLTLVGIFAVSINDLIQRMGNLTAWSAAVWVSSLFFAVSSVASAFHSWQRPAEDVRRGVRRFSIIVSLALLVATVYLTYWGIIGLRTWA